MSKKILIVEDEKPLGAALALKLRSAGFKTVYVQDGEAALAALQVSKFDLIILDLILPKKSGFSILEELRKMNISTPVIISTNLNQEEDVQQVKGLGVSSYCVKAETPLNEIVEKVKRAMV